MTLGIITSIQQSNAYQNYVAGSVPEKLAGRTVEIIGAASAAVSPYFQRKLVAVPALVVAAIASGILSLHLAIKVEDAIKNNTDSKSKIRQNKRSISMSLLLVTWGGGLYAFAKFADLPLGKLASIGISVATIGVAIIIAKN
jgi:hypothetical protein